MRSDGTARGRAFVLVALAVLTAQSLLWVTPVAAVSATNVTVTAATPGVSLVGLNTAYPTTAQDLSGAGATDWAIWGTGSNTSFAPNVRRSGGTAISSLTEVTGQAPSQGTITPRALGGFGAGTTPFTFAWSGGAPTASATAVTGGLQHNQSVSGVSQVGWGYSFTVPAGTSVQRLTLWIHAHGGTGRLTASVSGSSTPLDNTGVTGGENQPGVYTLDFAAATAGQTLTVSYVLDHVGPASSAANYNNVAIYAAALAPSPLAAVPAPVIYQAVPPPASTSGPALIAGRLTADPNKTYGILVRSASSCDGGVLGSGANSLASGGVSFSVSTDATGNAYFQSQAPSGESMQQYVTAQVVSPGSSDPSACIVASADNDTWLRAQQIAIPEGAGSTQGWVDASGRARWYKVAIQPGQRLTITMPTPPADFDMFVFRDIQQTYDSMGSTTDLTRLSAEFAPTNYSPTSYSPTNYSPTNYSPTSYSPTNYSPSSYSPSSYSPTNYSPSSYSPSNYSPTSYSPTNYSPTSYSPTSYSPTNYSPTNYSPTNYSPTNYSPTSYSAAQVQSLVGGSLLAGSSTEKLVVDTFNNTGDYYIRVSGKNGETSLNPFTVSVNVLGSVCDGVAPIPANPNDPSATANGYTTLILTDPSRIDGSAQDKADLAASLQSFADRLEVKGAIVDVGASQRVRDLNTQADDPTHVSCMYAKNLVALAVRDIVKAYRALNPGLKYVVIVGPDRTIPFFRYADQAQLGPEKDYNAPVNSGTQSQATLLSNYVLSQDGYGSSIDLGLRASTFPIPDLPVGRLVETAREAKGVVDAYLGTTGGVLPTPTASLVTGYDFLADAAGSVQADLSAGLPSTATTSTLITANGIAPLDSRSWTADQLKTALTGRHDIVFLAGHFSANSALAADFSTQLYTSDLASPTIDLANALVFSAGCHSGYNLADPDAVNQPASVDWAQAFARKQATLIAGTGYQYGDTDFMEYSERIYAEFAHQLRVGSGAVSIGDALVRSKQIYLETTPDIKGIHEKALLESTIFGLPMLSFDLPGRVTEPDPGSVVDANALSSYAAPSAGALLGLQYANVNVASSTTAHTVTMNTVDPGTGLPTGTVNATYYSGTNGVVTNPGEPAIPLEARDVTVPGKVLRGVGFVGGTYTDQTVLPLTGAPADPDTQLRGIHAGFNSPLFFPMKLTTANYFDALSGGGRTSILVTPAQHRTISGGNGNATLRLYSNLNLRLFYSSYTGDGARSGAPTLTEVSSVVTGGNVTFSARATGDPAVGVQQVWITYTGDATGWTSVFLTQDPNDSSLWSRTIPLPTPLSGRSIDYLAQGVNGLGLVTLDDNAGRLYAIGKVNQTVTFAPLAPKTVGDADFAVAATASSGLPVTFTATGSCTVSGTTVHLTAAGSCTITASQGGNTSYYAAPDVSQSFIVKQTQTITFAPLAPKTVGDADFAVAATASSGLPVTFTATGSCTVSGTTVHLTAAGSCTITASQGGNTTFAAAPDVSQSFMVKQNQTITFPVIASPTFGDPSIQLGATTSSGLTVAYTAAGSCAIVGPDKNQLSITGAGSCTATASQPGDSSWNAASDVIQSLTVARAPTTTVVSCPTVHPITTGSPLTPCTATVTGSGLSQSVPVTYTGNVSPGTATATATYSGDANHLGSSGQAQFVIDFRIDGFQQPINDPVNTAACPSPCTMSVFKGGSTVPVKFQLKRADGTPIQAAQLPLWITPVKMTATTASVDESVYSDPATSSFRWDSTAQQYIYNWSTKGVATGYQYRIQVKLPDTGQVFTVIVAIR